MPGPGPFKFFAFSTRFHTPLLPLYKVIPVDDAELTSTLSVWSRETGRTKSVDIKSPGEETLQPHTCIDETRPPRQQETSHQRQTFVRSRFRLSFFRQRVFYHHYHATPTTTTSLSGKFCLLESLSPYLSSPVCEHPLPTRRFQNITNLIDSQSFWLALYFLFNLSLTLYNKMILVRFPFPYTLTALHALCGSIGSILLLESGVFVPAALHVDEYFILVLFSILYAANIIVSNASLQLVTVPVSETYPGSSALSPDGGLSQFHQVLRAATPIFTILFTASILGMRSSRARMTSLIPVIAGVGLAYVQLVKLSPLEANNPCRTYGDYDFTPCGFFLTLLGTILAALKTILTNVLQSPQQSSNSHFRRLLPKLQLHPLDLLFRMSPLAFVHCVLFAHMSGELQLVRSYITREMTPFKASVLFVNGVTAFCLNVISFTANKKAGALSMTVAGASFSHSSTQVGFF